MTRLRGLLGQSAASEADWEAAEEALIGGDLGPALVARVIATARSNREAPSAGEAVRHALANLLVPRPPDADQSNQETTSPRVILLVGVNGTGKTTTIGKLALREREAGRRVILGAADTFRAAAAEQLRVWAERAGADIVAHAAGADPGAVVFDSLDAAVARGADMVIIDTAGRLHTKVNLMDELTKIRRIIDRRLPGASVETLFVLDATTGQNGLAQAIAFHESVGLSGIVLTKLDSTSRGGIVFAIEDRLRVPVRYIGVGEGARDLIPFDPDAFVAALYGSPGA
ncbi:MAG: signal recognition particle-docking protein FtsY [Chloroflexota bacterium]